VRRTRRRPGPVEPALEIGTGGMPGLTSPQGRSWDRPSPAGSRSHGPCPSLHPGSIVLGRASEASTPPRSPAPPELRRRPRASRRAGRVYGSSGSL
jgi:hypothetical protein